MKQTCLVLPMRIGLGSLFTMSSIGTAQAIAVSTKPNVGGLSSLTLRICRSRYLTFTVRKSSIELWTTAIWWYVLDKPFNWTTT